MVEEMLSGVQGQGSLLTSAGQNSLIFCCQWWLMFAVLSG